jgi:hypothetical protein
MFLALAMAVTAPGCRAAAAPDAAQPANAAQPAPAQPSAPTAAPATAMPPAAASGYSAAGLYNLANAYARAGKPGLAVLYYERARLLAPNDPDIAANLRHVRDASHLASDPDNWFARVSVVASPTLLAWTGVIGLLLVGSGVILGRLHARYRWVRRLAVPLGIALIALTVANGVVLWPLLHEAVVLTAAAVRVAPVPMGDPLFVLPEAETVKITAEHDEFVLVETRAGRSGWVARANIAAVVP